MARRPQPPWNFQCPYRHRCPHLEGLSTTWVWEEYQRGPIEQEQQWAIIGEQDRQLQQAQQHRQQLERELAETRAQLQRLHRRQFKANKPTTPADPDGSDTVGAPRKRGATPGHPGWQRPAPDHIDRRVRVPAPSRCPRCGTTGLPRLPGLQEHLQEDIVIEPRA